MQMSCHDDVAFIYLKRKPKSKGTRISMHQRTTPLKNGEYTSNTFLHNAKFPFDVSTTFRESPTLSDDTYKTAFDSRSTLWPAGQRSHLVLHAEQDADR